MLWEGTALTGMRLGQESLWERNPPTSARSRLPLLVPQGSRETLIGKGSKDHSAGAKPRFVPS